jgi:hypothetical protein
MHWPLLCSVYGTAESTRNGPFTARNGNTRGSKTLTWAGTIIAQTTLLNLNCPRVRRWETGVREPLVNLKTIIFVMNYDVLSF